MTLEKIEDTSLLNLEDPQPKEISERHITSSSDAVAALRAAEDRQLAACVYPHPDFLVFSVVLNHLQLASLGREVRFLAVDYASRFLSTPKAYANQETQNKWQTQPNLLTAAVVSLASSALGDVEDFDIVDFHDMAGLRFLSHDAPLEPQLYKVAEMELMVMETLEFRLRSVTAVAYLGHFLSVFPRTPGVDAAKATQHVKLRAMANIMSDERMAMNRAYRPSRKAFKSVMKATRELYPAHVDSFREALRQELNVRFSVVFKM